MDALSLFVSRNAFLVFLMLALGVTSSRSAFAQNEKAARSRTTEQEPPAVLKVTTRLVTVDVVARDHHGNPVRDLKQDDFQIVEQADSHKTSKQIASFRLLDRSLAKTPE